MNYLGNCFWLVLPVLAVNVTLVRRLPAPYQPELFSRDIPPWLAVGENASRIAVFLLPLAMPLHLAPPQWIGLALYLFGLLVYIAAWIMQIRYEKTSWSLSRLGLMAPSYTPALWLAGIALIGGGAYFKTSRHPWIFWAVSAIFLAFHNAHAWRVYSRLENQ